MDNWIKNLAIKAIHVCRLNKEAAGNHRQDMSLPVLERLQNEGYSVVTWDSGHSTHSECRDLNRQQFPLDSYIATTEYSAGIFSRSHPGDQNCTLVVSGEGLPDVRVDSYGDTDEAIGTSRPVKAPPAPKVIQKVLAPTPAPKVVEKPEAPETKIKYVPKEVHKQMKDPFEKQKEQQELDKEDWLKTLDKENVEEEVIPAKPTPEEVEEWQKSIERETSLKRPARWIMGIFEKER
jgi:hypothetical protein